jgi:cytochrome oxidase assembly protein ShyY1
MLKQNYCTADKIASDSECYEWAKSNPNSIARNYFCEQQHQDPICLTNESFVDGRKTAVDPSTTWFGLIMLLVVISIVIVILNTLRKRRLKEKYYYSDI